MKNALFTTAVILLLSCNTQKPVASAPRAVMPYEVINGNEEKTLKGLLSRSVIENDTTFKWFKANYALGIADAAAVTAFQKNASQFRMIIFGGTWCHDTQNLLPVFYRLADKAGYPDSSIILIGVDRQKQTLNNLSTAFHITNVPTFIVMKDGKEAGRVVEYGKYGQIDKELGEIVDSLSKY